jgi:hypothetical protein
MSSIFFKKIPFSILLIILFTSFCFPSIILQKPDKSNIPSLKYFRKNREITRPLKFKKITVAEYLTDPLLMYASLWGCFAVSLPLWETNSGINPGHENYWRPYSDRGFKQLFSEEDTYLNRLKFEPFATGRIEPITKKWGTYTVFRNDIYVKNIIEPIWFIYLGLYMRSKNYHPAIMVTEIMLLALLYEITIRPFYLNSSFEQLLKNPGISILFAILLDELSTFLLTTPHIGLHIFAYILNPFNALPNSRVHPMLFFDPYRKTVNIETIINF